MPIDHEKPYRSCSDQQWQAKRRTPAGGRSRESGMPENQRQGDDVTVIPFPRAQGRPLFLFSHRPEWPHLRQRFYGEWFENCLVNASVALLMARRFGITVAHAVPSRGCDRSTDLLKPGSGLRILRHESVFTCHYPSVFRDELLREFLGRIGVSKIYLVGFPANDVALASAIDARTYGYQLAVVRDCSPLLELPNVSVAAADHVTFGSIATFSQVENIADHLSKLLSDSELGNRAKEESHGFETETLGFFLNHLAKQADSMGLRVCAQKIRQAACDIFHEPTAVGTYGSDR
jgi:hypothetical protein